MFIAILVLQPEPHVPARMHPFWTDGTVFAVSTGRFMITCCTQPEPCGPVHCYARHLLPDPTLSYAFLVITIFVSLSFLPSCYIFVGALADRPNRPEIPDSWMECRTFILVCRYFVVRPYLITICTRKDGTEEFLLYNRWQVYNNNYFLPDGSESLDGGEGLYGWRHRF